MDIRDILRTLCEASGGRACSPPLPPAPSRRTRLTPRIDVQHYTIEADINPRTQSLAATAKVDFTPLDDADSTLLSN